MCVYEGYVAVFDGVLLTGAVSVVVTTPTMKKYRPTLINNQNGTVSVSYNPTEPGAHTLELNYAGVPLQGSPYKFTAEPLKPGRVSAFGPGLSSGLTGQPSTFTVVTKDAGPGTVFTSTWRYYYHHSLFVCLFVRSFVRWL